METLTKYPKLVVSSIALVIFFIMANLSFANLVTFEEEYTYQASEYDSKFSCKALALEQLKKLLLEKLGTYLESQTEVKNFRLTKDQIVVLTAGIVRTDIIDERWDGVAYYLKAKIQADPGEIACETGHPTARNEIHQALVDLSRRPEPDVTGAVQHALAALECVARDACGDPRTTLGDILRRYPDLLPRPLDVAVEKVWGYASEYGRHLREGREPTMAEAELLVGMASVVASYLAKKEYLK